MVIRQYVVSYIFADYKNSELTGKEGNTVF